MITEYQAIASVLLFEVRRVITRCTHKGRPEKGSNIIKRQWRFPAHQERGARDGCHDGRRNPRYTLPSALVAVWDSVEQRRESRNPRALPGGTPEPFDADREATLAREAFEENTVRIAPSPAYLGYQQVR